MKMEESKSGSKSMINKALIYKDLRKYCLTFKLKSKADLQLCCTLFLIEAILGSLYWEISKISSLREFKLISKELFSKKDKDSNYKEKRLFFKRNLIQLRSIFKNKIRHKIHFPFYKKRLLSIQWKIRRWGPFLKGEGRGII